MTRQGSRHHARLHPLLRLLPGLRGEPGAVHVARSVYGAIVALSLLPVLEHTSLGPARAAVALLATLGAVAVAEAYADGLAHGITAHRAMTRGERWDSFVSATAIVGAGVPAGVVLAVGPLARSDDTAFTVAAWLTVVVLGLFGFGARRLAGAGLLASLRTGAVAAAIGAVIAVAKALLH